RGDLAQGADEVGRGYRLAGGSLGRVRKSPPLPLGVLEPRQPVGAGCARCLGARASRGDDGGREAREVAGDTRGDLRVVATDHGRVDVDLDDLGELTAPARRGDSVEAVTEREDEVG